MRASIRRSGLVALTCVGLLGCGGGDNNHPPDGGAGNGGHGGKGGAGGAAGAAGGAAGATAGAGGVAGGSAGAGGAAGQAGSAGGANGGAAGQTTTTDAGIDLGGIAPPASLTVTVKDRRQTLFDLIWTAPSVNGQPATGYQIRYAKVPITATNFNDTTVTTALTYIGTPAAPGAVDGTTAKLYIENAYYFAVQGTNSTGGGTIDATTTAVAAHFNQTIINSPSGTNEIFGASADGSGDVNGDGISDIIVGTSNASRAYLFLGSTTFAGGSPSVTFSSATDAFFGTGVAQIGDINGDGLQDIAITDSSISTIYIYKGRQTWPATLADTDANYVISTSGLWSSASAGSSVARLGDFDGDGIDDFAIGGPAYNTRVGRVVVIYGSKTFANLTLPSATGTLEIGGDPALNRTQFGLRVVGIGHFYSVSTGTTLIVSAPGLGNATSTSDNQGRLYAFHGRAAGTAIDATMADNVLIGPGKGAEIGQVLTNLGRISNNLPSVGSGNGIDTLTIPSASGTGFVLSGTSATGPFASSTVLYQASGTQEGQMLFGGGVSGTDTPYSLIGSAVPDVAIVGTKTPVYIIDGANLGAITSPSDVGTSAAVQVPLPTTWSSTTVASGGLIPDINHDGYPDFVLADTTGATPGRVVVFW